MKRFISSMLILAMLLSVVAPNVKAKACYLDGEHENQLSDVANEEEDNEIQKFIVTDNNIDKFEENDYVPEEVKARVQEIIDKDPEVKVTVADGVYNNNAYVVNGTTSKWSKVRTYKGYKIKDWIVTSTGNFKTATVSSGIDAKDYCEEMILTGIGSAADIALKTKFPFGTAAVTLASYIDKKYGKQQYFPSRESYTEAKPRFKLEEKYTYVDVDGVEMLGCTSRKATIKSILWIYNDSEGRYWTADISYSSYFVKSTNYDKPDATAVKYFNSPYLSDYPVLYLGDAEFYFQ